jgi:hypothetical protein
VGSCIALAEYDPLERIGGMVHFMLPLHRSTPSAAGSTRACLPARRSPRAGGARMLDDRVLKSAAAIMTRSGGKWRPPE